MLWSSTAVEYFKRWRMEADLGKPGRPPGLAALKPNAAPTPVGYTLVPWSPDLLSVHALTKYRAFSGSLDSRLFPSLGRLSGCRKLLDELVRRPGFLPTATWLAFDGTDYAGCIQTALETKTAGMVQNIGVVPEHRGVGLGAALLKRALVAFREAGLTKAVLEVTVDNVVAVRMYRRLGFRKLRTVYRYIEPDLDD